MKRFFISFIFCGAAMLAADLSTVRTVYLLPMSKGLDQYLANRLTNQGVFQVVTDATQADAIFTDGLGESLEKQLDQILPEPAPDPAKPAAAGKGAPAVPAAKPDEKKPAPPPGPEAAHGDVSMFSDTANKLSRPVSSFGKSRGTIFLVDSKSRAVLWSTYELPKDYSSRQMDRTAEVLAKRLKRDIDKK